MEQTLGFDFFFVVCVEFLDEIIINLVEDCRVGWLGIGREGFSMAMEPE